MLFERRLAAITLMVWVGCVGCQVDDEIEPDDVGGGSDGGADAMPSCDEDAVEPCFVEGECRGERSCVDGAWTACQGLPELCDGADNDCDGLTDEGFAGLGDPCEAGDGRCLDRGRMVCADDGAGVVCDATPGDGSDEVCDGIDNDCDGSLDEEVAVDETCDTRQLGVCSSGLTACVDGDTVCAPSATPSDEICDGLDNDCDGRADEDGLGGLLAEPCYEGPDGTEGVGACAAGVSRCVDGMFGACVEQVVPGGEICDGVDNDCDGVVDIGECDCVPGETRACYGGSDGTEGVGACGAGTQTCLEDGTYGACVGQVVPGVEACDGIDNDCDGEIDDAPGVGQPCAAGLGACLDQGTRVCDLESGQVICDAVAGLPADEICDGVDNDCDGATDDVDGVGDGCSIGEGACLGRGVLRCDGDALACDAVEGAPSDETCNFVDDDCDGVVDDVPGLDEACDVGVGLCRSTARTRCDFETGAVFCPATAQDPAPFEDCRNRVDDDCDGAVDEADCLTRCRVDDDCPDPLGCVDGICEVVEICGNRLDDDGDGDIDCADADCADLPACLVELDCTDGFDDDADGDTDCADADCAAESVCLPEMDCFDRMDNDVDGDTDCDDADCEGDPACEPPLSCPDADDRFEDTSDNLPGARVEPGLIEDLILCDADNYDFLLCDGGSVVVTVLFSHAEGDITALLGHRERGVLVSQGRSGDDNEVLSYTNSSGAQATMDIIVQNNTESIYAIDLVIEGCGAPEPEPELCEGGVDEDGDGATDCDDADCEGDPACAPFEPVIFFTVPDLDGGTTTLAGVDADGAVRSIGDITGGGDPLLVSALAMSPAGELVGFVPDGDSSIVVVIDPTSAEATPYGGGDPTTIPIVVWGAAFGPDGTLFLVGSDNILYGISPVLDGITIVAAPLQLPFEISDGDIAFDADGNCYFDAIDPEDNDLGLFACDFVAGTVEPIPAVSEGFDAPLGASGLAFGAGDDICLGSLYAIDAGGVEEVGRYDFTVDPPLLSVFGSLGADVVPVGLVDAAGFFARPDLPECAVEICDGGVDDDGDGDVDCDDDDCADDLVCQAPPLSCPDVDDRFEDASDNLPGARVEPGLIEDLILCDADNYDFLLCDGGSVVVTVLFSHAEGDITALLGHRERGVVVSQGRSGDDDEVLSYTNSSGAQATMDVIVQNNTQSLYAIDIVIEGCDP